MVYLILLAGTALAAALVLLYLKALDAIRACIYNRRMARLRERQESFVDGYSAAMGDYARVQTYRVVLDRPKDSWKSKRQTIEEILDEVRP